MERGYYTTSPVRRNMYWKWNILLQEWEKVGAGGGGGTREALNSI